MYDNDQNYGWKSYDNQSYDNRQYGGDHMAPSPAGGYASKEEKGRHFKKGSPAHGRSLLFGTVSGAAMVGVNVAASRFTGNSSAASAEPEKKEDIPKARTESGTAARITVRAAPPRETADTSRARGIMEKQWRMCPTSWNRPCPRWWQSPVRRYTRAIITGTAGSSGAAPDL